MKKRHGVFFGFAVLLITAIFTLAGCDNDSSTPKDVLDGTTWESSAQEEVFEVEYTITGNLKFSSPDFELKFSYTPAPSAEVAVYFPTLLKGTYTVSGNNVSLSLEGGAELAGTISDNKITFPGDGEEPDVVYTKK